MSTGLGLIVALLLLGSPAAVPDAPRSPADNESSPPAGVVASVNGKPVLFEDLERQLGNMHSGREEAPRSAFEIDRLMTRLVDDELLAQEARALEMQNEEKIAKKVQDMRRRRALKRLEYEEITSRVEVSEEEVRRTFETEHRTATLRIITVDEQEDAEELLAQVRDGADFEALAGERSIDQYAARGGLMDDVEQIDMPSSLASRVWSHEPGDFAGPVRTSLGWAIFRVDAFADADPENLENHRRNIENRLRFRQSERLRDQLATQLQESFPVTVDQEVLQAIGCERRPDGRLVPEIGDPAAIVAHVGEDAIDAEALGRALKERWKSVRNVEAALALKKNLLRRLIRADLMQAEAARREYGSTPEIERAARAFEKELLVRQYIREVVAPQVEVTDEEIAASYELRRTEFPQAPRLHLGQITVEEEAEGERLAELLRQGTDLAWLARQHSIDRFKEVGGDRGWVVPKQGMDYFQDQLIESQPGDVFGPLGVPGNYIVIRVGAREEQGNRSMEDVSSVLRSDIFARKFQEYMDNYIERLREMSEITIYDDVLASMQISGVEPDREESSGKEHSHN